MTINVLPYIVIIPNAISFSLSASRKNTNFMFLYLMFASCSGCVVFFLQFLILFAFIFSFWFLFSYSFFLFFQCLRNIAIRDSRLSISSLRIGFRLMTCIELHHLFSFVHRIVYECRVPNWFLLRWLRTLTDVPRAVFFYFMFFSFFLSFFCKIEKSILVFFFYTFTYVLCNNLSKYVCTCTV